MYTFPSRQYIENIMLRFVWCSASFPTSLKNSLRFLCPHAWFQSVIILHSASYSEERQSHLPITLMLYILSTVEYLLNITKLEWYTGKQKQANSYIWTFQFLFFLIPFLFVLVKPNNSFLNFEALIVISGIKENQAIYSTFTCTPLEYRGIQLSSIWYIWVDWKGKEK